MLGLVSGCPVAYLHFVFEFQHVAFRQTETGETRRETAEFFEEFVIRREER